MAAATFVFSGMARRLRFIPPGSLVEVTCRTVQGRLLLRPTPTLRELTLGVLARAARLYPVEIHAFAFLSNHFHLLVTVPDAQRLASFMNYLNSNLAREAGRLVGWREKFWGRRYQAVLVSREVEAQIARLRYVLAHGVKEGLVGSPLDWPGAHCAQALLHGTLLAGRWIDRTRELAASRKRRPADPGAFETIEELRLAPLPCWKDLAQDRRRSQVCDLLEDIEHEGRRHEHRTGQPPLGRDFVLRQDPRHEPNRLRKGPAPLAHAASRATRDALKGAYRTFLAAYRQAAERLRSGALDVHFPTGAFPPALPFRPAPG
jgi:REP element-mobilizing transposase RayT